MLNKINISSKEQAIILSIILAFVILAVFWQVNQFDFVNLDDYVYVTDNRYIHSGITLKSFLWAFSTTHADSLWHPIIWLSLMFDYHFYGLNAGGYHLTNVILHILSSLLLFWLFNRMTKAIWKSAFVAALFALHPMHVESVAWISERKDVLSAFFWMLTLCMYIYYTENPSIRRYLLVLVCFAFGLMSKPMVVTLPFIMILLDYWPLKRFESKKTNYVLWQLKEKKSFFILSAVFSMMTIYTQYDIYRKEFPFNSRIANAFVSFGTYLEKTFWPRDMAFFYPFTEQIPLLQVFEATLLLTIVSFAVMINMKRMPFIFVGWLWYVITLIPVIGIIQSGDQATADRYHYLPSIGIAVILAWGIPSLINSEVIRKNILLPLGIVFLVIMAVLSWRQCGYWKNSIALSSHALRVTKNNYLAHGVLAYALFGEGKLEEAVEHANEAIRLNPNHDKAYEDRAVFYFKLGQYQHAIEDINVAVRLKPDDAPRYYLRGNMLKNLGQYQHAINDYNEAIRLKQDYAEAYNERGGAYFNFGQYQGAINDYNDAIRIKHDYAEAYNNRAFVFIHQGKTELGCGDAQKACALGNCKILEGAKIRGFCR